MTECIGRLGELRLRVKDAYNGLRPDADSWRAIPMPAKLQSFATCQAAAGVMRNVRWPPRQEALKTVTKRELKLRCATKWAFQTDL